MRKFALLGALVIGVALAGPAAAQSPLEGPLATPDAASAPKAKSKAKPSHPKKKIAHHDASQPDDAYAAAPQTAQPVVRARREAPADPLDVGMKWNGSNDSARETRVQNYDGSAPGTGAEVGLKLHF